MIKTFNSRYFLKTRWLWLRNNAWPFALVFCCGIIRVITWAPFLQSGNFPAGDQLLTHLGQSFYFCHVTPPLSLVLNSLLYAFGNFRAYAFFLFLISFSMAAAYFLFATMRLLKVLPGLAFTLTLFYSIIMLRIELFGFMVPDYPVYLILPLFIWSIVKTLQQPRLAHYLLTGIFSGLLLMSSVTPGLASLGVVVWLAFFFWPERKIALKKILSVLLPIAVILCLGIKNYLAVGVFHISTKGGENGLQLVSISMGWSKPNIILQAMEAGVPKWWLWCYLNSNATCYGDCLGDPATPDYQPLYQELTLEKENALAALLKKDAEDQIQRPWILSHELSRRFSVHYGVYAQKVWAHFLLQNPAHFFHFVFNNSFRAFYQDGPLFPLGSKVKMNQAFLKTLCHWVILIMAPFWWAGIGLANMIIIMAPPLGIGSLLNFFRPANKRSRLASDFFISPFFVLSLGFFLNQLLVVIGTCCENDRMFWLTAPYSLVIGGAILNSILSPQK